LGSNKWETIKRFVEIKKIVIFSNSVEGLTISYYSKLFKSWSSTKVNNKINRIGSWKNDITDENIIKHTISLDTNKTNSYNVRYKRSEYKYNNINGG
jgi:hypothetical protein